VTAFLKRSAFCWLIGAVLLVLARNGMANGRYPAANEIVFDPVDPTHLILSTTFGLLESHDSGATFSWRCDPELGVQGEEDTMVAITAGHATVATTIKGIIRSTDGCSFAVAPEFAGKYLSDLALVRAAPHQVVAFATTVSAGQFNAQVVQSVDDGQSWQSIGATLPSGVLPYTIDVAPSDPSRMYLSARVENDGAYGSVLLRSDDGGQAFKTFDIPETTGIGETFIAAVHPSMPDVVYLRVYDPSGTALWMTVDGGQTFQKTFTGADQLLGFAVSPDGSQIAFGGPGDGLWVGASDGTGLERRSDLRPNCLGWRSDGLYAGADQKLAGFSLGRSLDSGATFEPMLRFDSLCGRTECGRATPAASLCPDNWQTVSLQVGSSCRDSAAADGGSGVDAAPDSSIDRSEGGIGPSLDASGGGCAIAIPSHGMRSWIWITIAWFAVRRRTSRINASVHAGWAPDRDVRRVALRTRPPVVLRRTRTRRNMPRRHASARPDDT